MCNGVHRMLFGGTFKVFMHNEHEFGIRKSSFKSQGSSTITINSLPPRNKMKVA